MRRRLLYDPTAAQRYPSGTHVSHRTSSTSFKTSSLSARSEALQGNVVPSAGQRRLGICTNPGPVRSPRNACVGPDASPSDGRRAIVEHQRLARERRPKPPRSAEEGAGHKGRRGYRNGRIVAQLDIASRWERRMGARSCSLRVVPNRCWSWRRSQGMRGGACVQGAILFDHRS